MFHWCAEETQMLLMLFGPIGVALVMLRAYIGSGLRWVKKKLGITPVKPIVTDSCCGPGCAHHPIEDTSTDTVTEK